MDLDFLTVTWPDAWRTAVASVGAFAGVLALTRVLGLRSFAKLSSFDFAMTVAIGSLLASTAASSLPLARGLVGLACLYALQGGVAWLRLHAPAARVVDNSPVVLMAHGRVLDANMSRVRVTPGDLRQSLRLHGITERAQVRAVIFETTGDLSVLRADQPLEHDLVSDVRDAGTLLA